MEASVLDLVAPKNLCNKGAPHHLTYSRKEAEITQTWMCFCELLSRRHLHEAHCENKETHHVPKLCSLSELFHSWAESLR